MWKVYAVKTIYRTETTGEAYSSSEEYSDLYDMVEERILTVKARSFDEAIERVEKETEEYASDSFINPFGQKVQWFYTGKCLAYEPYDSIPANLEVFSNTYLVLRSLTNEALANNLLGSSFENEKSLRLNFLNSEFSGFR